MFEFLSPESKSMSVMGFIADLVILNIIFLICCIPVITIPAAYTALNSTTLKIRDKSEAYLVKHFFQCFKSSFKQATIIGLIIGTIVSVLLFDISVYWVVEEIYARILLMLSFVLLIFCFIIMSYVFPMVSYFENTTKNMLKDSFKLAVIYFPHTLLIGAINLIPFLLYFSNRLLFVNGVLIYFLIGFALTSYMNSVSFLHIFHDIQKKTSMKQTAGGRQ